MNATASLDACRAARIPKSGLAVLAPLRRMTNVRVIEIGQEAWITWDGEMPSVVNALLAIEGSSLYRRTDSSWLVIDRSVPDFSVPHPKKSLPLDCAVVPNPIDALPAPEFQGRRIPVTLKPCDKPRPTTAQRCRLQALAQWGERATTAEIEVVTGAWNGTHVWLRGRLPALPTAERFWGERVLIQLGWRADPDWPEAALLEAAIVDKEELLVLTADGPEAIALAAFKPLSRARIRRLITNSE
jgi:MoxR-vWA-beta-propeller ternary system domain bpX2